MVQFNGKFEQVSTSPDFEDFLNATQIPKEIIKGIVASKATVTIEETAGDKFTISTSIGDTKTLISFKLGEPFDETKINGIVAKNLTTRDGNILTTKTTLPDGKEESKAYEFTADGLNLKLSDKKTGKTTTIGFKRV